MTDAHAVLGHFPLDALIRNHIGSPDIGAAGEVLDRQVAQPLNLSVDGAAEAVLEVVAENMAGRIRLLTVERGLDIRTFDLVAFGGAGPLHVCALMRKLGIARAFIPPYPGLTSALGTVMADVRHDFVQTFRRRLGEVSAEDFSQVIELHRQAGKELLAEQGIADTSAHELTLAFLYEGQRHSVDVGVDADIVDQLADSREDLQRELSARFQAAYEAKHGSCLDRPVVLVSLRSTVVAEVESLALSMCADALRSGGGAAPYEMHAAFAGLRSVTRVVDRSSLDAGDTLGGPAIVVQRDTTTLIEPGFVATDTVDGILVITEAS